jgi:hypothetical protein
MKSMIQQFSVLSTISGQKPVPHLVYQSLPTFPLMGDMSARDELKEGTEDSCGTWVLLM